MINAAALPQPRLPGADPFSHLWSRSNLIVASTVLKDTLRLSWGFLVFHGVNVVFVLVGFMTSVVLFFYIAFFPCWVVTFGLMKVSAYVMVCAGVPTDWRYKSIVSGLITQLVLIPLILFSTVRPLPLFAYNAFLISSTGGVDQITDLMLQTLRMEMDLANFIQPVLEFQDPFNYDYNDTGRFWFDDLDYEYDADTLLRGISKLPRMWVVVFYFAVPKSLFGVVSIANLLGVLGGGYHVALMWFSPQDNYWGLVATKYLFPVGIG